MREALFPFSADPVTFGHLALIERGVKLVEERLYVVVLNNQEKQSALSLKERSELVLECIKRAPFMQEQDANGKPLNLKVRVSAYEGLLADFALKTGVRCVLRGLRRGGELHYERELEAGHKKQLAQLEFIYLAAQARETFTGSRLVKSVLKSYGQIESYVPLPVKKKLEEKVLGQYRVAVTGGIASGKSYLCKGLLEVFQRRQLEAYEFDFDHLVQGKLYAALNQGEYPHLKTKLLEHFGEGILNEAGALLKERLSQTLFNNQRRSVSEQLRLLQSLLAPFVKLQLREKLKNRSGLLLFNAPLIAEYQMLHTTNNIVLLVEAAKEAQLERLQQRGLGRKQAEERIVLAGTTEEKRTQLEKLIKKHSYGKLLTVENNRAYSRARFESLAEQVLALVSHPQAREN